MPSTVLDATRREFLAILAAAGLMPACDGGPADRSSDQDRAAPARPP